MVTKENPDDMNERKNGSISGGGKMGKTVPLTLAVSIVFTAIAGTWALSQTIAMASYARQVESNRIETVTNRQVNSSQDVKLERISTLLEVIAIDVADTKRIVQTIK